MSRSSRLLILATAVAISASMLGRTAASEGDDPGIGGQPKGFAPPHPATDIYLTFDDGPHPTWTPRILAVLRKYNARATFFMLGQNAASHPKLVRAVREDGHFTANHTWSHPNLTTLSNAGVRSQLARTDATLGKRTCVRPPYGGVNPRVASVIRARGQRTALWDVDTRDWQRPGTTAIANRITRNAKAGQIILMHDGGGDRSQSVAALDKALATLTARGFTFSYVPYC